MKKVMKNVRNGASGRLGATSGRPVDACRTAYVWRPVDRTAFNETRILRLFTRTRVFQALGVAIFGPPTAINRILKAINKLDYLRASKILRREFVLIRSSSRTNLAFAL